jgi:hypothetical protein
MPTKEPEKLEKLAQRRQGAKVNKAAEGTDARGRRSSKKARPKNTPFLFLRALAAWREFFLFCVFFVYFRAFSRPKTLPLLPLLPSVQIYPAAFQNGSVPPSLPA